MSNEIKIRAFQHISFEAMKNGVKNPMISSEVCVGEQNETILEESLSLDEALDRLIERKTRGFEDSVTAQDRKILLSQIDSILEIVQSKKSKIMGLPTFTDSQIKSKKIKP